MEMQPRSYPNSFPISSFCVGDFPARAFQSQVPDVDLRILVEQCFLKWRELLPLKDLSICTLRTFPACLTTTPAGRFKLSLTRWMNWGMMSHGRCLTAKISEFPRNEKGLCLSDFLEDNVPEKYYLSRKQVMRLLYKGNFSQGTRVYSPKGVSITLTSEAGGVGGKSGLYLIEGNGLPIISKTKEGYQIAFPGDSIDTAYAGQNSRRGRVGHGVSHTLTTSSTQAFYFVDMNPDPKITELARCITTRQDSGISKHKGEHSAVFVECFYPLDMNDEEKFAVIFFDENGDYHIGRIRKLTPRECWRLQGFTDAQFDKASAAGLSDSKLYKMAGNAVTVPVISAVGQIIKQVEERSSTDWKNTTEKKQLSN